MEMRISEEEAAQLLDNQKLVQNLVYEIGKLEVAKVKKIGELSQVEAGAQRLLAEIKDRYAIPDGTAWQVLPDGSVKILGAEGPPLIQEP